MRQDYFVFLNVVEEGLNYFFGLDLSGWWIALSENGTDKFWIAGVLIFLALIFIGGFFFWGCRFLAYCLMVSFVGLILVTGKSPSLGTVTLVILYVTGTLAAGTGKNRRMAFISSAAVLILSGVLLFVSAQVGVPVLKSAFGDVLPLRTKIQQTSLIHVLNQLLPDELKFQDGTGEYEGGSLETQGDNPEFSGRTVVTVESDKLPEKPVYWARYMGNVYTGYSFNDSGDLENPQNPSNIRYPSDVLSELENYCKANPKDTPEEAEAFIRETLQNETAYNLHVDALPEGEDFIEYFFFQSKEGYCIHYAATAVMMLRMYGIPARYVTGFLIPPSLFYLNEDGAFQADVPDNHAHAWAEAYINGSWVRVETTPQGGLPESVREEKENETNKESETPPQNEAPEQIQEGTMENAKPENGAVSVPIEEAAGDEFLKASGGTEGMMQEAVGVLTENMTPSWVFIPVILVLAVVLIFVGMVIRRFILLERRRRESVQEIFADLMDVLVIGGLSPALSILSEELEEEILKHFPWISKTALEEVLEMVLRTTYGPDKATYEERKKVQEFYYRICLRLGKEQKAMAKIVFYMVDVWI